MRSTNVLIAGLMAITLAGCGGGDSGSGAGGGDGGTRVTAMGDSITAGAPLWDPDPATRASLGPGADEASQYEYWAERKLGDASVRNCGISGQRTDEIAQRFDECTRRADVLIVQGGANDIAQQRSVESAAQNLRKIVQRGKEHGLRVAITNLVPWPGGHPQYTPRLRRLNELIARIGAQEDVSVVDFNAALADPARPGLMRNGYVSDDQIHPTVAGYRKLGEAIRLP
jgi:lysophospholipase L1-like esterase